MSNENLNVGDKTAISKDIFKIYKPIEDFRYLLHWMRYLVKIKLNKRGEYKSASNLNTQLQYEGESELNINLVKNGFEGYKVEISGYGVLPKDIRSLLSSRCHIISIALTHIEIKSFYLFDAERLIDFANRVKSLPDFINAEPPVCETTSRKDYAEVKELGLNESCAVRKEFILYGHYKGYACKLYKIIGFSSHVYNFEIVSELIIEGIKKDSDLDKVIAGMVTVINEISYENYKKINELVFAGGNSPRGRMIGSKVKRQRNKAIESKRKAIEQIKTNGFILYSDLLGTFGYSEKKYANSKMASKFIKLNRLVKKKDEAGHSIVCAA